MIVGFIEKYNLTFIQQIKMQIGIFNGIGQNRVNLPFIKKANIMIGIVIAGINLMQKKVQPKERLENYLALFN